MCRLSEKDACRMCRLSEEDACRLCRLMCEQSLGMQNCLTILHPQTLFPAESPHPPCGEARRPFSRIRRPKRTPLVLVLEFWIAGQRGVLVLESEDFFRPSEDQQRPWSEGVLRAPSEDQRRPWSEDVLRAPSEDQRRPCNDYYPEDVVPR